MFKVIEFEELSGDGGLCVVRDEWLTPRKKECLWPPCKLMSKFNKCLTTGTLPDENWKVYAIKRIFYETDDLIKAREKCKKAESDSEILTEAEENGKKKRKRKVINYNSDDESNQETEKQIKIKYPVPPQKYVKDPLLIEPVSEATALTSCTNDCNVGLYYGASKPNDANSYLRPFVDECIDLENNGIIINDKKYAFRVSCITADAPARAFLKCIKSHNSLHACEKCTQEGTFLDRTTWQYTSNLNLRTDLGFNNEEYEHHQIKKTILTELDIGLVMQVPFDYMH